MGAETNPPTLHHNRTIMTRIPWFVTLLLILAIQAPAQSEPPAEIPVGNATAEEIRAAVHRAIGYLQKESADWLKTRKCAACHHVPMPLWALSVADRQGYEIDKKYLADTTESLLGSADKLIASKIFPNPSDPPDPRPQGKGLNVGLPFLAVAARSMPALQEKQKESLTLIVDEIVKKQQSNGCWEFFATLRRPPINENQFTDAAWIIMALAGETDSESPELQRVALEKAIVWFDAAKHSGLQQEIAMKLLVRVCLGKPLDSVEKTIAELQSLQRADGGWSQTIPEPRSDAFATGQSLYALSVAGYTADRPEMKRGIDFLVATQLSDGSWPMVSRATPNGEPGSATLMTPITCAATSWATLGLVQVTPRAR